MSITTFDPANGFLDAHSRHRTLARWIFLAAILLGLSQSAAVMSATTEQGSREGARTRQPSRLEFLVASGTLIPTGNQRHDIRRADMTTAQLAYVVRPELALSAALGWARSRDIASEGNPRLDIFTYDLGAEFRPGQWPADRALAIRPFAGIGAGGRSYSYRSLDAQARHHVGGYIGAGGEVGTARIRLRLELRDYLSGFNSPSGERSGGARNDLVAVVGLRIVKR